eukprot:scaffold1518_cov417-Prasinococcus_capsulatus_cf.AAC.38
MPSNFRSCQYKYHSCRFPKPWPPLLQGESGHSTHDCHQSVAALDGNRARPSGAPASNGRICIHFVALHLTPPNTGHPACKL